MKRIILFAVVFLLSFFASEMFCYGIQFTSPTNGQVFRCGTDGTAAINIMWSSSGQRSGYYYFSKLFTDDGSYSSGNGGTIPQWLYRAAGSYSWRIEMWEGNVNNQEYKVAEQTISFCVKNTIYASNNFGSGTINLENSTVSSGSYALKSVGESVSVGAIDQSDGTYNRIWNTSGTNNSYWKRNTTAIIGATSRNYSYTVVSGDNSITLTADLKKLYNATFQNSYGSGTLTVAGNSVSSPATTQIVEGNNVTVNTPSYVLNNSDYLDYYFSNWDGTYTTATKTFTINSHETHTANYTRKANVVNCFAWDFTNVAVGNYIQLTWNEHPNSNVTKYRIWRKEKNGTEMYIATVNRGTTSYTDNSFQYASSSDPDKNTLFYRVSVYCSLDGGTWNEGGEKTVTAVGDILQKEAEKISAKEVPSEYKLENYPNPFNPTTTISYQLPEAGMITLKVYDMLGKEVATLVNEVKQAGYYSATFDASKLASGIYISTIQTNKFTQSKKMSLVK
jgi:hypothetical protein